MAAFVAFVTFASPAGAVTFTTPERALLQEMNATRAAHGLKPLALDWRLQRAARAHSRDMLRRNYFAHGPFGRRVKSFGVRARKVGENLAWGAGYRARARVIVRSWLASPSHRANLLRPGFRRVGVASLAGRFAGLRRARVVTANFAGT